MPVAKLIDYSSVLRPYTVRKVAHIESSDNLMHYGIKGMKWGVRRTKEQLAHDRSSIQARMNSQLRTPVKASNGILVTRFSDHALDRTQTESRPVTVEGILDALKNPLNHGSIKTKTDNLGRPSQQFIGNLISFQNTHGIGFYFFSHDIRLRAQYIIFRGKVEQ